MKRQHLCAERALFFFWYIPSSSLAQSCLGWGIRFSLFFSANSFFRVLLIIRVCAGSVMQQDKEPLDGALDIFFYVTWCTGQLQQCVCEFWQHGPDCPGSFFTMPSETGHGVTPSQSVDIGSARGFSGPTPAAISWAARYRKLFPVPNNNGQQHDVGVSSPHHYGVVAMLACMGCMQQHATVSFFMAVRGERGQIRQC